MATETKLIELWPNCWVFYSLPSTWPNNGNIWIWIQSCVMRSPYWFLSVDNLRLFRVYASLECAHTVTCVCSSCPQVLAGKNSYNVILARQPLQVELTHLVRFAQSWRARHSVSQILSSYKKVLGEHTGAALGCVTVHGSTSRTTHVWAQVRATMWAWCSNWRWVRCYYFFSNWVFDLC